MLFSSLATVTQEALNEDDLYPLQNPSLFAKIKLDLFSVKLDSVFTIFSSEDAILSSSFKYSIFFSLSKCVSTYKFKFFISLAKSSLSGKELNSSSGVFLVVSKHFSIWVLMLTSKKFAE